VVTGRSGTTRLVPELLVSNLALSLGFWRDLCGFAVVYDRPAEGFACLERGGAEVMLEDVTVPGRRWITGPLEKPFGRGINFEIAVEDAAGLAARIAAAGWPVYLPLEEKTYRTGATSVTVRQFAVQDPDGYLLRFSQRLGGDKAA
jgi:catechol 2,3-dioxygenase-like lactoylglutathione lyase family enzyme